MGIKKSIKTIFFQLRWKKENKNRNGIIPKCVFPKNNVMVGKHSYGELRIVSFGWNSKLIIGNYVSIAQDVIFLMDAEHYTNHISTFPFITKIVDKERKEAFGSGDIIVSDDVWIGYGATIMSGVTIGQGAIIAARALVTKDVPPYAIVGGIPARIIKYRFEDNLIEELKRIDFNSLTDDLILKHEKDLYQELVDIDQLKWLPKKKIGEENE